MIERERQREAGTPVGEPVSGGRAEIAEMCGWAVVSRKGEAPRIHHSDRGVQYASQDYLRMLEANDIAISKSRVGNPYDNAYAETFMKTLKTEEGDGRQYRTMEEAQRTIDVFIGTYYNEQRLHQSPSSPTQ